jgi:hypothetical protein
VSSAEVAEPLLDLSHDFVGLEWLQESRFLFQLCTPCQQDRVHSRLPVIAFINNLLDGHFPFLKTHRLVLLEFGIVCFDRRDTWGNSKAAYTLSIERAQFRSGTPSAFAVVVWVVVWVVGQVVVRVVVRVVVLASRIPCQKKGIAA